MADRKTYDDLSKAEADAHCAAYVETLGPRLDWFIREVGEPLDGSRGSLDSVGRWLVAQPSDVGDTRDGIDLPLWVLHEPGFTAAWGPRTLCIADGLVAYMADCYRRGWPETFWRAHHGKKTDIDYRQPMLWIDGGRGYVNLPHRATSLVHRAVIARTDQDPGRVRHVWEIGTPQSGN